MNWLGIKTAFSQMVLGTMPEVDGKPVLFEVWLSPSVCRWDYVATDTNGPYRMVRADNEGGAIYGYAESPHFIGLMTEFATQHMPRRGEVCAILDRYCTIVLGWLWNGEQFEWRGCEEGFDKLSFHHPVSAALWEREAHAKAMTYQNDLEDWS